MSKKHPSRKVKESGIKFLNLHYPTKSFFLSQETPLSKISQKLKINDHKINK